MARAKLTAVVDTSPIIALHAVDALGLLNQLFELVLVPMAVAWELAPAGGGSPELTALLGLPSSDLDATCFASSRRVSCLGMGEKAAIVTASCRGATVVLDDLAGRKAARAEGCHVTGTVGVLLEARRRSIVPALKPLLEQLVARGFRLSPQLVDGAVRQAGE